MNGGDPDQAIVPLSMGAVARRSWRVCRENFRTLVSVGAVPWLCIALIGVSLYPPLKDIVDFVFSPYADNFGFNLILLVPFAFSVLIFIFLIGQGALIHAVTTISVGREVRFGRAYRFSLRKILGIIGPSLSIAFLPVLVILIVGSLVLIVMAVFYLLDFPEPPRSLRLKGTLCLFVLIYVYSSAKTALFDKVIFVEPGKESSTPLRRSWKLVRNKADGIPNILRSLFFVGISAGMVVGAALLLAKVFRQIHNWAGMPGDHFLVEWVFPALIIFVPLVTTLFGSVGLLLLYFDIRLRTEGFDPKTILEES
jgi:hypothetical protein